MFRGKLWGRHWDCDLRVISWLKPQGRLASVFGANGKRIKTFQSPMCPSRLPWSLPTLQACFPPAVDFWTFLLLLWIERFPFFRLFGKLTILNSQRPFLTSVLQRKHCTPSTALAVSLRFHCFHFHSVQTILFFLIISSFGHGLFRNGLLNF